MPEAVTNVAGAVTSLFANENTLVALTIIVGTMLPALSIGWIGAKAMEAIGRNPESAGRLQTPMILAIAFTEALAIYCLVVALIIKFVKG